MPIITPIQFETVERPHYDERPGRGRGRSPLTDAILATVGTTRCVRVNLEGRSAYRMGNRLRANLKRYHVRLRVQAPIDASEDCLYVSAFTDKRPDPTTDIPFEFAAPTKPTIDV